MTYVPLIALICLFIVSWSLISYRFAIGKPVLPPQNHLRRARWRFDLCIWSFGVLFTFPSFLLALALNLCPQLNSEILHEPENARLTTDLYSLEALDSSQNGNEIRIFHSAETNAETNANAKTNAETDASLSSKTAHPVLVFLRENPSPKKYLFIICFTALLAPILEEFLFRLLLQGWFDARERELFVRKKGNGWRSVFLTTIIFCLLHYRSAQNDFPTETMFWLQNSIYFCVSVFVLLSCVWLLHGNLKLSLREIGLDFSHWKNDVRLGVFVFTAFATPSYLLLALVNPLLSPYCAGDFIALFPISLGFGLLYWRTRRLLPSVVAHSLFNGFAILNCWALS